MDFLHSTSILVVRRFDTPCMSDVVSVTKSLVLRSSHVPPAVLLAGFRSFPSFLQLLGALHRIDGEIGCPIFNTRTRRVGGQAPGFKAGISALLDGYTTTDSCLPGLHPYPSRDSE